MKLLYLEPDYLLLRRATALRRCQVIEIGVTATIRVRYGGLGVRERGTRPIHWTRCAVEDPDVARLSLVQEDVETTFVTYGALGCAFVSHSIVLLTFAGLRYVLHFLLPTYLPPFSYRGSTHTHAHLAALCPGLPG